MNLAEAERLEAIAKACAIADWEQILRNGGPPCFYLEGLRSDEVQVKFCLRAERWAGHGLDHKFVSLSSVFAEAAKLNTAMDHLEKLHSSHCSICILLQTGVTVGGKPTKCEAAEMIRQWRAL